MVKLCVISAILSLSLFVTNGLATESQASERQAILSLDEQYIEAFNAKDIAAVMKTFTDDAIYVTDFGKTLRGKEEIQSTLQQQFKERDDSTLKLNVYAVEFSPDKNRATERGVSIVTTDGVQEPSSYVAEFSKQGEQWRVSRVVEQAQAETAEHLRDLEWMIGDWADQSEDVDIRTKVEWSLDRAFITRRFAVTVPGRREMKGIEYIGWDSVRQEIHSWYFDSEGGYGGGRWKREGKSWSEEAVGITPGGEIASATHTFTAKDSKTFTWRSVNRKVGGEAQDDIPETTIQRVNSEQSDSAKGQL